MCFEQWSKTKVVLYDVSKAFLPIIPTQRKIHNHPICRNAKIKDNAKQCNNFDFWMMKNKIWQYPEGCLKYCHCGLLEWCMPVTSSNKPLCIIEAGIRRPCPETNYPFPIINAKLEHTPENCDIAIMDIQEAELIMEGLRQLAARLQVWYELLHQETYTESDTPRQVQIYKLFQRNYRSKLDLSKFAKALCLSPSRTAHVIKEVTGKSFKEMLTEYRMREICLLLQTTNQAVSEIAYNTGFTDLSHFYRVFKQQFKVTPRQYRVASRSNKYTEFY